MSLPLAVLAEHALTFGAHRTIVTEAADTAGPLDQVTDGERRRRAAGLSRPRPRALMA